MTATRSAASGGALRHCSMPVPSPGGMMRPGSAIAGQVTLAREACLTGQVMVAREAAQAERRPMSALRANTSAAARSYTPRAIRESKATKAALMRPMSAGISRQGPFAAPALMAAGAAAGNIGLHRTL